MFYSDSFLYIKHSLHDYFAGGLPQFIQQSWHSVLAVAEGLSYNLLLQKLHPFFLPQEHSLTLRVFDVSFGDVFVWLFSQHSQIALQVLDEFGILLSGSGIITLEQLLLYASTIVSFGILLDEALIQHF